MPDLRHASDAERGLENRLEGPARAATPPPAQPTQPPGPPPDLQARWREQARAEIARRRQAAAPEGWRLSSVEITSFGPHELADPARAEGAYDFELTATIVYERERKGTAPSDLNHSWSRETHNVGELIQGERTADQRQPVASRAVLDQKGRELDAAIREQLARSAKAQAAGEPDPGAEARMRQLIEDVKSLTRVRIDNARTEQDFAQATEDLAKLPQIGADEADVEALRQRLAERYAESAKWKKQAAEERPQSVVAQQRYARSEGTSQLLGAGGEPPTLPSSTQLTADDRRLIESRARVWAEREVPRGCELVSVSVEIPEARRGDLTVADVRAVTITAVYRRSLDPRGLPTLETESWQVPPAELLGEPRPPRRPVVPEERETG